jgi:hypothetical protein
MVIILRPVELSMSNGGNPLASRKFWLAMVVVLAACSAFINALLHNDAAGAQNALQSLIAAVGIYTAVEGTADVVGRYQNGKVDQVKAYQVTTLDDPDPDEDRPLVPGN